MSKFLGKIRGKIAAGVSALGLIGFNATAALAFKAPAAGDTWYEAYEVFYDRLVTGPIGGTLAGGLLCWGLIAAIRGAMAQFVICSCAAAVIFNLENVVVGFGLVC